jgi:hypothetical protein
VNAEQLPANETVYLHRAIASITPHKVQIRPARSTAIGPLIGLGLGAFCLYLLVEHNTLPMFLLILMLLFAVFVIPLSGMALVYSVIGASVIADGRKGSIVWQQGVIGLGVGTRELVPFAKINHFEVEEEGERPDRWRGEQDALLQLQLVLVKQSGKRLRVGTVIVARWAREEGIGRISSVGERLAALTERPFLLPEDVLAEMEAEVEQAVAAPASTRQRRRVRRPSDSVEPVQPAAHLGD